MDNQYLPGQISTHWYYDYTIVTLGLLTRAESLSNEASSEIMVNIKS